MKFTGKERDAESGLDYFDERYFSSAQGRFTSPDALIVKKEWLGDPQRWNHYAYVRNNPLRYVDPNGEDLTVVLSTGDLSPEQLQWYKDHGQDVRNALTAKLKAAGVTSVTFKDSQDLTPAQRDALRKAPANSDDRITGVPGVVRLEFAGEWATFQNERTNANGDTNHGGASVLLNNIIGDDASRMGGSACNAVCAVSNVAAHEIGHALGFDDPGHNIFNYLGLSPTFRMGDDVMKQGGDPFAKPLPYRTDVDKNRRAIEEVNRAKPYPQ